MLVRTFVVLVCAAAVSSAQPFVAANGMVNAASSVEAGLPNGDVAQGSMFSIYGSNMGPATAVTATSWPLPTTQGLGGVTVQVQDSAGVSRNAVLLFVYSGQINADLPSATATGQASLTVTYNGQTSVPQTFNVVESSVGLLARNQQGSGPGIVQQYHGGNPSYNDISNSAIPGDVAVLWGTGLGPISGNDAVQPTQVNLGTPAEVFVGGQQVPPGNVQYEGRSSFAGEDQINFVVPNIPGCYVPVFVKIGNIVSNTVSMSIGAGGGMCTDDLSYPGLTSAQIQANGLKRGVIALTRTTVKIPGIGDTVTDTATGVFDSYTWSQLAESRGGLGVSVYGACTVFTFSGSDTSTLNVDPVAPTYLDAGTLSLAGPAGQTPIPATAKGSYSAKLGTNTTALYFSPGAYTVTGAGGADVGPFTSTLTVPAPFTWTNMDALTSVTRANGVIVNWTGGTGHVVIAGLSGITSPQKAGAFFRCLAQASAQTFTVPAAVLLALPVSGTMSGIPLGELTLWDTPVSGEFNPNPPTGLDAGDFSASFTIMKFLSYN